MPSMLHKSLSNDDIILTDKCRQSNKKIRYIKLKDETKRVKIEESRITSWNYFQKLHSLVKNIFLPKGYPHSVSSDYLEYQLWDSCQAFCSSICGTLTMQAIMEGIGVGSEAAKPASAAIAWIMKDGTGMLGSILFAWIKGSKFDSDCKKWRLFADVLNDAALFIELSIPRFITYSMHMLCIATALKALVGTAGGSTRAAFVTHQAIKGNIADVSAKDGSQELFTNLLAYLFGILLLKNITEANEVWIIMCIAVLFHIIFNYKAVRCLKMNVFNSERLRLSLLTYLPTSSMPTIEQVNRRESVFLGMGTSDFELCGFSLIFGVSINNVLKTQNVTGQLLSMLVTVFQDKKYLIVAHVKRKILYVSFRENFNENDVIKAYFHAFLIGISFSVLQSNKLHIIKRCRKNSPVNRLKNMLQEPSPENVFNCNSEQSESQYIRAYLCCEDFIEKEFTAFCCACMEEGWNTHNHLINIDDWRAEWKYVAPNEKTEYSVKRTTPKKIPTKYDKRRKSKMFNDYSSLIIS